MSPVQPTDLDRYLAYLRAIPEVFRPGDGPQPLGRMLTALIDARRIARQRSGLSEAEIEAAARLIAWAREHASDIDAAEAKAEAPFISLHNR
jgi:hypothetical protein